MRFRILAASLALLSFASKTALAAECYSTEYGSRCAPRESVVGAFNDYCVRYFDQPCRGFVEYFFDITGTLSYVAHTGKFGSLDDCISRGNDIVDSCYGWRNGGSKSDGGASLNINFCQW